VDQRVRARADPPALLPEVTLITHDGKRSSVRDLVKDRCVVMNFMYARCQGSAARSPATPEGAIAATGPHRRDIFMYSFTLKPDEDSPDALAEYVKERRIGRLDVPDRPPPRPGARAQEPWLHRPGPDSRRRQDQPHRMVRYGNEPRHLWAAFPACRAPRRSPRRSSGSFPIATAGRPAPRRVDRRGTGAQPAAANVGVVQTLLASWP